MIRNANGRGLFYTRDSGGKHEATPRECLLWAVKKTAELGLEFDARPDLIDIMIRAGNFNCGDV
jgi:hypothetical protein